VDVALERQRLLTLRGREVAGSHLGTVADQAHHRQRPSAMAAGGVEARQASLHFRQLVTGQRVTAAQLHARVRPGDVQRDPVHAAVALRGEVIEQGRAGREPGAAGIVLGDVGEVHLVDGVDGENPDRGAELAPGAHPRPRPAPEHDGDRAVGKTVQDVALEEHPGEARPSPR